MNIHDLRPAKGSTKKKRRVARGIGSGMGKTATRGTKGQKARRQISPWFEGGQTPIHRRLPVKKGFRNINHKEYAIVNIQALEKHFEKGDDVSPEALIAKGLIHGMMDGIKVLGHGDLSKKLKVSAHHFSKTAADKIAAAGGETVVIAKKDKGQPVKKDKGQPVKKVKTSKDKK